MVELMTLGDLVDTVTEHHPDDDAHARLTEAVSLAGRLDGLADRLLEHFVDAAREAGLSWADISAALGPTRQSARRQTAADALTLSSVEEMNLDGFTPRARAVVTASEQEARAAGHPYLGTEHLVLGLLSQPEGLAAKYLALKTAPERLRSAMAEVFGPSSPDAPDRLALTPRGKQAVELSRQEAQRLGHEYVGTEHLLLGVLAERHGAGAKVLMDLGVEEQATREWIAAQ